MKKIFLGAFMFFITFLGSVSYAQEDQFWPVVAKQNGKWGVLGEKNQVIVPFEYDYISKYQDGFAILQKDNNTGFADEKGKIKFFSGKNVISTENANITNRIAVEMNEKIGFVDREGNLKIPFYFDAINPFSKQGYAAVEIDEKWGIIDTNGKFLFEPQFEVIEDNAFIFDFMFEEGFEEISKLARAKQNGKWGYISMDKKIKIDFQFDYAQEFKGLNAIVYKGEKQGIINQNGRYLVEPKYDMVLVLDKNPQGFSYAVKDNDKLEFLDDTQTSRAIIDNSAAFNLFDISQNLKWDKFLIRKNEKFGVVNLKGKEILPAKYQEINIFENSTLVREDNEYHLLNKNNDKIFSNGENQLYFEGDRAVAQANSKYGMINQDGKWVIKPEYDFLENFKNNRAAFIKNDKLGFLDENGNEVIKAKFDNLIYLSQFYDENYAIVSVNLKQGIIDKNGTWIVEPKYEAILFDFNEIF